MSNELFASLDSAANIFSLFGHLALRRESIRLGQERAKDVLIPLDESEFSSPIQADDGLVVSTRVLWSDPTSGQSAAMVKFTGINHYHVHTYNEQVLVVNGSISHYTDSVRHAEKRQLQPGAYLVPDSRRCA